MTGGSLFLNNSFCGQLLCANSFLDKYQTKDGKWHNGGRRYRYLCSGAAMKRNGCDGQTVYTAQKVDEVVISVLHECFKKLKVTPKDAAIEKRYKAQIKEIKQEIKKLEKETETLKRKMSDLASEIANALIGESKFTEARLTDKPIELSEIELEALNRKMDLVELLLQDGGHPTLSFTYFEPDSNKEYLTRIGIVKKIDTFTKKLILYGSDDIENKKIPTIDIPLDGIIDISGFPNEFDEYKN